MTTRDFTCFSYGFSAGVCLALLFAPRSGAEIRHGINEKVDHGRQLLRDKKEAAYKAFEREKEGIAAALDAAKQGYREAVGRAKREASA